MVNLRLNGGRSRGFCHRFTLICRKPKVRQTVTPQFVQKASNGKGKPNLAPDQDYLMKRIIKRTAAIAATMATGITAGSQSAFAQVEASGLSAPTVDTSLLNLFWEAGRVVKIVMIGLLLASVWCWAIIVDKMFLFARTKRQIDKFEQIFWSGQSLEELYRTLSDKTPNGMGALFVA